MRTLKFARFDQNLEAVFSCLENCGDCKSKFIESECGFDSWYIDPLADMTHWIPDEIQNSYGSLSSGGMGVDVQLSLNPKFEDQIRRDLAAHGYWAVRDDDLVMATFEWEEGKVDDILSERSVAK